MSTNKPTAPKTAYAPSSGVTQKDFEREITSGLPNEAGRMRDAWDCLRYSMGRFEEYPTSHKDQRYRSPAVRRTTPIFKRAMEVLTMHLYKNQPTRKLRSPAVTELLQQIYRRNYLWPKFKRADQLTLVGGFAAIHFSGSTDPHNPVSATLWGADQLAVWVDPDDSTKPIAVACIDKFDGHKRLRLWTKEELVTYVDETNVIHPVFGVTAFKLAKDGRKPNPYRDRQNNGILPWAFMHWQFPAQDFETNSPGLNLKELNWGVNERLDNLGDSIYFNARPIGVAEGVDDAWTPPAEIRPGDFITLPPSGVDVGGNGPRPTLSYLLAPVQYIAADWEDLNNYLDHTLEMWGIPPALIRMIQTGARSGASIQAEQLPILGFVEGRRADFSCYEEEAARVCLMVAESHLRNHEMKREADEIQAELDEWSFSLRWPVLYVQLPGPDRDRADDWRLEKGIVSVVGIVEERQDLTEEEAIEHLQKVKEQKDRLAALGIQAGMPPPAYGLGIPPVDPREEPGGGGDTKGDVLDDESDPALDGGGIDNAAN
jgi:hypothetical protein